MPAGRLHDRVSGDLCSQSVRMGTLYLVRHGQASFGATDYDQLSALGQRQAQQLGSYWQARGVRFDAIYTGSLQRHQQTLEGITHTLTGMPPAHIDTTWNEYDSQALLRCMPTTQLPPVDTPEGYKAYFRLLCDALAQWMSGVISPEGMPSWQAFSDGIHHALEDIRKHYHGGQVLVVSSGGPIGAAVSRLLGATPEAAIALNMRLRNTSVTELSLSPKRVMLQTFNTLSHLDHPDTQDWITFA